MNITLDRPTCTEVVGQGFVTQAQSKRHTLSLPEWIAQDLTESGIKDAYLRSLVTPIRGKEAIAKKLNWKFWDGSDGWESTGAKIDGSPNPAAWQLKAQSPPLDADGKPRKYLNRKGKPTDAYLPMGTLENFPRFLRRYPDITFPLVQEDESICERAIGQILKDFPFPIVITEGIKKCLAGWQTGWATLSVPGVTSWHKKGKPQELKPTLEALFPENGNGREVYLAFDADFIIKPDVWDGLLGLGHELERRGYPVKICVWEYTEQTKGMDDFISSGGDFSKAITTALTIAQWEKQFAEPERAKDSTRRRGNNRPSPIQKAQMAISGLGLPLRFNELSKEIESTPGEGIDADALWVQGCADPETYTSVDTFYRVLSNEAKKDRYHPIAEYLRGCHKKYGEDVGILEGMAKRYLGTDDPLHQVLLIKWLIGAVARAMTPGCKMDTALILHGLQGIGKSTFFNILAGEWFTDSLDKLDSSNKDELLKAHQSWIIELGEIENAFSKTAISKIKQSMSATTDQIRPPYGRKTEKCKRGFVVCGTTNNPQFLNDPTGNRRFWVVSCNGRINRELLTQEREQIWAAAYALWLKGEQWHLTEAEDKALAVNNEEFQSQDPWTVQLELFLEGTEKITVNGCLEHLGLEPSKWSRGDKVRVEACLVSLGYKKAKFRINGKPQWGWRKVFFDILSQKSENLLERLEHPPETQLQQGVYSVPKPVPTVPVVGTLEAGVREAGTPETGTPESCFGEGVPVIGTDGTPNGTPQNLDTAKGSAAVPSVPTVTPTLFQALPGDDKNAPESLTPDFQLKSTAKPCHGDPVLYVPYGGSKSRARDMIYVGPHKNGRHWIVPAEHFQKGMKGSRQYCTMPRLDDGRLQDDIFWVKS